MFTDGSPTAGYHDGVNTPTLTLTDTLPADIEADRLILGVIASGDGVQIAEPNIDDDHADWLHRVIDTLGVKAEKDSVRTIPSPEGWKTPSIVLVGIPTDQPDAQQIRYAAGAGAREAGKRARLAIALPGSGPLHTRAAIEGALLGGYRFDGHKTPSSDPVWAELIVKGAVDAKELQEAEAVATAVWQVRDLVNTPPNTLYPEQFRQKRDFRMDLCHLSRSSASCKCHCLKQYLKRLRWLSFYSLYGVKLAVSNLTRTKCRRGTLAGQSLLSWPSRPSW